MVVAAVSTGSALSAAGKACARESRLVMSFFAGRLCRFVWGLDFSIREMRDECLMVRLSFLEVGKALRAPGWVWRMAFEADLEPRGRIEDPLVMVGAIALTW